MENNRTCKICNLEVNKHYLSTHVIKKHNISNKDYYDKFIKKEDEGVCTICGNGTRYWGSDYANKNDKGYHYSFTCSKECRKKHWNNLNLEKYGVENNFQVEKFKEKSKKTCLEKYGVENSSQNKDSQLKKVATNLKKYGGPSPTNSLLVLQKTKKTCLEKYGVEHPMQCQFIAEKCQRNGSGRAHAVMYTTKFGNIIHVQGSYEFNFVQNCEKNNYYIENGPNVDYYINEKKRKYFIDFKINKHDKVYLIEIKSSYHFKSNLKEIFLKKEAAEKYAAENNMTYELIIMDLKGGDRRSAEFEYNKIKKGNK